ncbi:MAG: hypothetical protein IKH49_05345 [Bacteroidales bacterium]|nr:hypothetical protein [Bacteroidales bacterium]
MKKIGFMIAVLGTLFIACNKQEPIQNEGNGPKAEMVKTTFGASFTETKVTLDGYSPKWSTTDKIKVYYEGGSAEFTLTDGAGSQNATFTGYVPIDATVLGAAYPADIASELSGGNVTFSLPKAYDSTSEIAAPMCATLSGQTLKFRNVTSLLKVTYQNNISEGAWGGSPAKFEIYCEGYYLSGDFTCGLQSGNIEQKEITGAGDGTNNVGAFSAVTFTGLDLSGSEVVAYVPVPAGSYPRFVSEFLDASDAVLYNTVKNIQRKSGTAIAMGNNVLVKPTKFVPFIKWEPVPVITPGKFYLMTYTDANGIIHVADWEEMDLNVKKQSGFVARDKTSTDLADIDEYCILYANPNVNTVDPPHFQLTSFAQTSPASDLTEQTIDAHYNINDDHRNLNNISYTEAVSFVCNNWNDGEGQKLAIKYAFEHTNQDGTHVTNVFGAVNNQRANEYLAPNYQAVTLLEYKPAGLPEYELNH